jgi:hypothetical protein
MSNGIRKTLSQQERRQRWARFLALDPQVSRIRILHCLENLPERPPLWPGKKRERIDWMVRHHDWQAEQAQWLDDDKITHIDCLTGTEIFAEAFGCKVHRPEDNMPFALPVVHNAKEAAQLGVPDLFSSPLALQFELADAVRERVGKDVPLRLPDIQSPMDIAALIWDKADFYIAMLEEPEAVQELAAKVRQLMISFLDEWFRRYGTSYVAHFPPYPMEGGLTLSEDEIGVVNPGMFQTFFLPELRELSERYGGLGMHCCADAAHQWPGFLQIPGLRFLNLIQPADRIAEAIPFFSKNMAQWHGVMGEVAGGDYMDHEFPEAHLVLETTVNTRAEAEAWMERLRQS